MYRGNNHIPGTGGPSRGAAKTHADSLRKRNVATIRQRRNDQAIRAAQVLAIVAEIEIGDGNNATVLCFAPVETTLLEPVNI